MTGALFFYRELYTVPSHFEEYRKEPMYRHDVIDAQENEVNCNTCYFLLHVLFGHTCYFLFHVLSSLARIHEAQSPWKNLEGRPNSRKKSRFLTPANHLQIRMRSLVSRERKKGFTVPFLNYKPLKL